MQQTKWINALITLGYGMDGIFNLTVRK